MKEKGFTLVELLVVLVIGSIIMMVVMNLFIFSYNLWFKGQKTIDYQEQLRFALDRMAREVRTATAVYNPNATLSQPISPATAYSQIYLINTVGQSTYRIYYYLNTANKTLYRKVYYPAPAFTTQTEPLISDVNFVVYYLNATYSVSERIYYPNCLNLNLIINNNGKASPKLSTSVATRVPR
ncbi:PilW family protein [Carboxydothermus pertinax]|uniref:Prepilin-type N-terminal cleavage/methylation domain-containing protein n=1 Tax=Carboxydothermus pertinax TaxID=870242 RepID=A0A1L8CVK3_9THEO|nr:prepilin-type N-terminal cleavage/methylation domain-containing protein [Carboxydothermus pertinax]GAV22958.1 prepilin-type N-terminal cleavage/methylation domain-containing protein [Carboxydothermus pertinax]